MLTLHFIFHLLDHKNISKIKFYATTKQCQNKFLVFCALCNDGMHYAMMVLSIVVPPVCENADTCSSVSVTTSFVSGVSGVHWWYTSVQTEHSLLSFLLLRRIRTTHTAFYIFIPDQHSII